MYRTVFFLCVVPFVSCDFGLDIQPGRCPALQGTATFNPATFQGIWTVSQRSNDLFTQGKDCETQMYLLDGNNFQVFTVFSNRETEMARGFQARTVNRGAAVLGFIRSLLSDNIHLKGTQTIVATDNTSFAVTVNCFEMLNFRILSIYVLIKGLTPPPNLDQLVNQALAANQLALNPPLSFRDLEGRCT